MSETPLVTVLMPCYNAMPYLQEALNSVLSQAYEKLEILCINDGSTDKTGQVLESYAEKDVRVRVVHNNQNLKLIRSLNKGLQLANGEYIARIDADDYASRSWITECIEYLRKFQDVSIVSTSSVNINEAGVVVSREYLRQTQPVSCAFASYFYVPLNHGGLVGKKDVLRALLFKEHSYVLHTEDYEILSRAVRLGYKIANINKALYTVRINPESVSRRFTMVQDENFIKCAKMNFQAHFGIGLDKEIASVVFNRMEENLHIKSLKRGVAVIKNTYQNFIKSRLELNKIEKSELKVVYITVVLDLLYQVFKKSRSIGLKCFAAFYAIPYLFSGAFEKKVIGYYASKFKC